MHEAKMHNDNHFVTLTYSPEQYDQLPNPHSLHKPHLQKFFKRLRFHGYNIRYYACGEYGDLTERPHYHAIIFNLKLPDKKYLKTHNENKLYTSKTLEQIWGHGHVTIGHEVTFETCAYVSRYIIKKWKAASKWELQQIYQRIEEETGLVYQLEPEFQTMSRRPGIGKSFYDKYKNDMYQDGTDGQVLIRGGIACATPSFYDFKFESESKKNFQRLETIKKRRRETAELNAADNTQARLDTKESILKNKTKKQLLRPNH